MTPLCLDTKMSRIVYPHQKPQQLPALAGIACVFVVLLVLYCICDITGSGKFFNMTGGSIGTLSIIDCGNQNSIQVNFAGTITNKAGNFFPQPAHRKPIRHRAIFS